MRPLGAEGNVWESGNWVLGVKTAEALIGGYVYLHKAQTRPSHYGGRVIGYRVLAAPEPDAGRLVIHFQPDPSCKGVLAGPDGWGNEKKLVL